MMLMLLIWGLGFEKHLVKVIPLSKYFPLRRAEGTKDTYSGAEVGRDTVNTSLSHRRRAIMGQGGCAVSVEDTAGAEDLTWSWAP